MWSELINLNIIRTDFCVCCVCIPPSPHPTHGLCLCHLTLGSGRAGAAEVQPSHGCCLDDIITHTFIFILSHTHSPSCKTWTNTALMFLRTETLLSLDFSYQIQFNVFYTVCCQLSHLCHAHYSHLSDNHWYNRNQSKDCHHYQWMIQHLETLSLDSHSLSCVLTHTRCALAGCHP